MAEKRRGLGRGLGALIPQASDGGRPVDVFFAEEKEAKANSAADSSVLVSRETHDISTKELEDSGHAAAVDLAESPISISDVADESHDGSLPRPGSVILGHKSDEQSVPDRAADNEQDSDSESTVTHIGEETELVPVPGASFSELDLDSIVPNPKQPRTVFDEEALIELTHSVQEIGVLQPIVVRPLTDNCRTSDTPAEARYEIVMGERRWRASQRAGKTSVPAIIRETTEDDLLRDALLENLHRSNLNPLEEAAAYQQLLNDFGCSHDELAQRIGRSRPQISNMIRLMKLPPLVQRRVASGVLSAGHARALLGLSDNAAMERLAQRIVAEGLSVRSTEEIVAMMVRDGESEKPKRKTKPRAGDRRGALDDLATRLSDLYDTRVQVALGKKKGKLTVEFASVEDLNRILELIAPKDEGILKD